ncbi:hypothetical protein CsSME_00043554 [Camellia sinensis var. sinensis]
MNEGTRLKFQNPIGDAITRIRFAPKSNNLLISSWDTSLRLYDLDSFMLRVEAPSEAALLDCCFQNESVAFGAGSDSFIRRYDLDSGIHDTLGNHDDLVSCVEYSAETRKIWVSSSECLTYIEHEQDIEHNSTCKLLLQFKCLNLP